MVEIAFFAAAFFAEVVGTLAGFGSSTVFLPLALFFVDFRTALVLVAFFHIFGNLGRVAFFRHGFDRRLLLTFAVPSVVATVIGASLVAYISQELLKLVLGVFLLLYAVSSLLEHGIKIQSTRQNAIIGGTISGFLAGLIGTGGALRGAFLTSFALKKERYVATAAAVALAVDATRIPIYIASGFLQTQYYTYIPPLFVIALAGSYTGKRIVDRVSQKRFKKLVLVAIGLIGLKFVVDGLVFFL